MRMWMIDPKLLCRKHLLGEHGEIHKHLHCFIKQYKMDGRKGQIEPKLMKQRHDELAVEMLNRGYKHESSYLQPDISYLPEMTVDKEESLNLLLNRCVECRIRYNSYLNNKN